MFLREFRLDDNSEKLMVKEFLRRQGCSAALLKELKREPGRILVDGAPVFATYVLHSGQKLTISLPDEATAYAPADTDVPVIYEDDDFIVFDKPSGMAIHPSRKHQGRTLANVYARIAPGEAFRALNRIDRDTTGLVLCARSKFACAGARAVEKTYHAVAPYLPPLDKAPEGVIDMPIRREKEGNVKRVVSPDGQRAVTNYRMISHNDAYCLLELWLETGRTHQIRVHFSHIGLPLCGDSLYGGDMSGIGRQALHCTRLRFTAPGSGRTVELASPLPDDMANLCDFFNARCC